MSSTTVAEFAKELKKPTDTLIEQLKAAGVNTSSESDSLTEKDKQKLLTHLQTSHGTATTERKKISLVKKSTSEIKQADATGKPEPSKLRSAKNGHSSSAMRTSQKTLIHQNLKPQSLPYNPSLTSLNLPVVKKTRAVKLN